MSTVKPFLAIDNQIDLLKQRNLNIFQDQYDKAKEFLLSNNYYRVSGYSLTLRRNDVFSNSASLDVLIDIYEADRRMRHIMLSIIEVIEVKTKALVSYYHSEKHGPLGYMNKKNFCCSASYLNETYDVIIKKANSQKKNMIEFEPFLKHHKENKSDILPFWVYVELLTISDISKLYNLLERNMQNKIATQLSFNFENGYKIVSNLLHCVTILRNICAHGGRLYNRLFITKPSLSKKEKGMLRVENNQPVLDKLFSYVLVLKSLSTEHEFKIVAEHIKALHNEYRLVDFRHYGFPDNWQQIL